MKNLIFEETMYDFFFFFFFNFYVRFLHFNYKEVYFVLDNRGSSVFEV